MKKVVLTPMKAIRAKCIDCTCGQLLEIRLCPIDDCPLHPYRMGKRPDHSIHSTTRTRSALKNVTQIQSDQ